MSFSKQVDCSLTTGFSDPKRSLDFPETGPNSDSKIEQLSQQTKDQRWEVGKKSKISTLRHTIFSSYQRRKKRAIWFTLAFFIMLASRPFHKWTSFGVTTIKTSPELRELAEGSTSRVCICLDPAIQEKTFLLFTVCQVFMPVYYREGYSWNGLPSTSVLCMIFS